jgi:superfamily II DNA or RNA helicase
MQPEIKKASLEMTSEAKNNNKLLDINLLTTLNDSKFFAKISEKIFLPSPSDELLERIIESNTFANPKYSANELNGHSNWQTAATIETYQKLPDGSISVPRGFLPELLAICNKLNIDLSIADNRVESPIIFPPLNGVTLRPYQERVVFQAMQSDHGVVISPTGSGKSIMGLEIIRRRTQKSLIIVHRGELARQWQDKIRECMGIKTGFIGDGEWTIGDQITIAMVQTLASREIESKTLSNTFGLILLDEVHHAPASTFFEVLGHLSAKFLYGLSATIGRADGLEKMIYRAIGPAVATISKQEVEGIGATVPAEVISIQTGFNPGYVNSWCEYLDSLSANSNRNMLIISLAQKSDGAVLIIVDRVAHAEQISDMLSRRNIDHVLAHGKVGKKDRDSIMERIRSAKITVGTTALLGEGIDVAVWGTLIMGAPISSEIKLMQAIGRIVRPSPGKEKALVYDLKDDCGFSGSSFNKRFEIYKKHKIWVKFSKGN